MESKVYLDEKGRLAHDQELLREAEKRRLLAQLPRHRAKQKQACCREAWRAAAQARGLAKTVRTNTYCT
jgi:hypothetical protein